MLRFNPQVCSPTATVLLLLLYLESEWNERCDRDEMSECCCAKMLCKRVLRHFPDFLRQIVWKYLCQYICSFIPYNVVFVGMWMLYACMEFACAHFVQFSPIQMTMHNSESRANKGMKLVDKLSIQTNLDECKVEIWQNSSQYGCTQGIKGFLGIGGGVNAVLSK